jgi:hypothetical protein
MALLAVLAPLGLLGRLDVVYNLFLGLVLAGLVVTIVQRGRATYRDLQPAR